MRLPSESDPKNGGLSLWFPVNAIPKKGGDQLTNRGSYKDPNLGNNPLVSKRLGKLVTQSSTREQYCSTAWAVWALRKENKQGLPVSGDTDMCKESETSG